MITTLLAEQYFLFLFSRYLAVFHGPPVRTFSVKKKKSRSRSSQPNDTNGSLGSCPKTAILGLGYSLSTGVSQSPQEMPELRTIGFVSYTGQLVLVVKNPPANAGDVRDAGSIPGLGKSLEEGMATYPSTLAWRIPRTEEPDGLQTIGSQRVGHD